jgi:uncharacterized membrane protein
MAEIAVSQSSGGSSSEKMSAPPENEMVTLNETLSSETIATSTEIKSPTSNETNITEHDIQVAVVEKSRRIIFTDAAVAIALTLLILPLLGAAVTVQEITTLEWFQRNTDFLITFFLSFNVVALSWINHERLFASVKSFTRLLSVMNFLWLLAITFLPAATNIMNSAVNDAFQHFIWIGTILIAKILILSMTFVVHCTPSTWNDNGGPSFSLVVSFTVTIVLLVAAMLLSMTKGGYFMLLILGFKTPITRFILWKWPELKTKWEKSTEPETNDGNNMGESSYEHTGQDTDSLVDAERFIGFIDAAAAIALTLLVLPVMDAATDSRGENLNTLEWFHENRELLLSFFLSYMVVTKCWSSQDRLMRRILYFTRILSALNFLWLLAIVFVPVATALMMSSKDTLSQHAVYIGTPLFATLCTCGMTMEVHLNPGIWQHDDSGPKFVLMLDSIIYIVLFILALVISFTSAGYLSLLLLILKTPMSRLMLWKFPSLKTRW